MPTSREKIRISADPKDVAFRANAWMYAATLDGVPVSHCRTADEARGEVEIYETRPDGEYIMDSATGRPRTRILRGTVVISRRTDIQYERTA